MKFGLTAVVLTFLSSAFLAATEEPKLLVKVTPLPVALDPDFSFRKTKPFFLSEKAPATKEKVSKTGTGDKEIDAGATAKTSKSTSVAQDASTTFERKYRLFGAVTKLDQHQLFGNYFD